MNSHRGVASQVPRVALSMVHSSQSAHALLMDASTPTSSLSHTHIAPPVKGVGALGPKHRSCHPHAALRVTHPTSRKAESTKLVWTASRQDLRAWSV